MVRGYIVDLERNSIIDKKIKPTESSPEPWLYAINNKYPDDTINREKIGKWMLFIHQKHINTAWEKIKIGVATGALWQVKVSTKNPDNPRHAIMVYTKDFEDLEDVTRVLTYLEAANIKPRHISIYYKTNQQTRAGIYSGGKKRPWIYDSNTVHAQNILAQQVTTPPETRHESIIDSQGFFRPRETQANLSDKVERKNLFENRDL
jgi:hypothetical protein